MKKSYLNFGKRFFAVSILTAFSLGCMPPFVSVGAATSTCNHTYMLQGYQKTETIVKYGHIFTGHVDIDGDGVDDEVKMVCDIVDEIYESAYVCQVNALTKGKECGYYVLIENGDTYTINDVHTLADVDGHD